MIPLRDDSPPQRTPVITAALVAANVVAFLWQHASGFPRSVEVGGAIPYELLTLTDVGYRDLVPPPLTIFTSMFLHAGLLHLGANMLFLWVFGRNVEDALGRLRFLAFYLAAGVAAAVAQTLATAVDASRLAPADALAELSVPMIGASGAIGGVLAAYLLLFPRARVKTLFFVVVFPIVIWVPAVIFLGGWFLGQVVALVVGSEPGVAVMAHVGGFLAGWVLLRQMGTRRGWRRPRVAYG